MKLKSLSSKIIIFVVIIAFVGAFSEAIFTSQRIKKTMSDNAEQSMYSEVNSAADLLGSYAQTQYAYIQAYIASPTMQEVIETSDNCSPTTLENAQVFTESFIGMIPDFDSIVFTNYDGTAIVHNDRSLIGFRNPQETIDMINAAFFTTGTPMTALSAIVSPATNQVSLCVMSTTYKSDGTPSGYATLALKTGTFNEILDKINISPNQTVILTSIGDGSNITYIYNNNKDLITQNVEEPELIERCIALYDYSNAVMMTDLASTIGLEALGLTEMPVIPDVEMEGVSHFKNENGEKMLGYFKYLPDTSWIIDISVDEATLYAESKQATTAVIGIATLACVVMVVLIWFIVRFLTKPIGTVQDSLERVAALDLRKQNELEALTKRSDEIGRIAKASLDVTGMMRDTIEVLKRCSISLNESSSGLKDTTDELVQVTLDNNSTAGKLSAGVDSTNTSITSVNDEITKIQTLVAEVSEKVKGSESDSESLIENTKSINRKVDAEIDANNKTLDTVVASMQDALSSLEAVEKINDLVASIMEITSQTNLLALNASIEAARAGESGRGFAVVADEIGKLAEQSRSTAESIQSIVGDSNNAVEKVRGEVGTLLDYVKGDVVKNFEEFASESREYGEGVSVIKTSVASIGTAMATLNESISEIAREIGRVAATSGENSDGVKDIVQKNEQTGKVTNEIGRYASDSKQNASDLEEVINKFSL